MGDQRQRDPQILVAGVGNAWLGDDGFGGNVIARLQQRELPAGVQCLDFGTGGLDLAYEVIRGYDALVLLDVSRQGGEPGTLYVMEPDEASVDAEVQDGQMLDPHGMDPQTVLRFVKLFGGWPGMVLVIACEPTNVEEMGMGLSEAVAEAVDRAADLVLETIAEIARATPTEEVPTSMPRGLATLHAQLPHGAGEGE
jgi:hydrogenase maturation protease